MAQRVFVRVSCDPHPERNGGQERFVERTLDDDQGGPPPFLHVIEVDGVRRHVYACDECFADVFASALAMIQRWGTEPIANRKGPGRPSTDRNRPAGMTVPAITPTAPSLPPGRLVPDEPRMAPPLTTPPPPKTAPPGRPAFVDPASGGQLNLDNPADEVASPTADIVAPKTNVVTLNHKRYPCVLCFDKVLETPTSAKEHLKRVHGIEDSDIVTGTMCHACGYQADSPKALGPHFGTAHVRPGHDVGGTIWESMTIARAKGDPHGTIAAMRERLATVNAKAVEA
jgi:hypothetical protein